MTTLDELLINAIRQIEQRKKFVGPDVEVAYEGKFQASNQHWYEIVVRAVECR